MKYKTILNRFGKKIDLHICQTKSSNAEKLNDVIDVEPIEL